MNILYIGPNKIDLLTKNLPKYHIQCHENLNNFNNYNKISVIIDASLKINFNESLLSKFKRLNFFIVCATGCSHVNIDYLKSNNIKLFSLLGCPDIKNITAAAEFAWTQVLGSVRKINIAEQSCRLGNFDRLNDFNGFMLNRKTIGIFGCGRIGSWLAKYAIAFNMTVLGCDPNINQDSDFVRNGGILVSKKDLLNSSDIISLSIPYNKHNHNFIDFQDFEQMKNNVIFTSISIGEIVNENALLFYLQNKKIKFAALDYLHYKTGGLFDYFISNKNLMITPRIGGFCEDALDFVLEICCKKIIEQLHAR